MIIDKTKFFLLALLILNFLCISKPTLANSYAHLPMEFRYWDWGKTTERDNYQFQLLEMALEATKSEFGGYTLVRVKQDFSTARARIEIGRGKIINVHAGPWRVLETSNADVPASIRIDIPIFNNIFGYRKLVVVKNWAEVLIPPYDKSSLKRIVLGQAKGWVDVDIYRFNGLSVNDTANVTNLISMLQGRRFDAIPFSMVEVKSVLDDNPELTVVDNLTLFFPLPMVFYVTATRPDMAQRISLGLKKLRDSGQLNSLLYAHFQKEIDTINALPPGEVIYLENPLYRPL